MLIKKIADFIVDKRKLLLIITLVVTALCGYLATQVKINTDMTKYLADDSNMQQGLTLMNAWFSEAEEKSSIRVMFDDLSGADKKLIQEKLEDIPYVSSVSYEADSEDYNVENHTLFILNSKFDYGTEEETSIEQTLGDSFSAYTMQFCNNDLPATEVPPLLLLAALGMLLVILLIMSDSWLDPVLFLATIGIAVVINLGTNIVFPYTAELTASIGPILQLALSMDYSIILMNKYREQKGLHESKTDAMKSALASSVKSISASSLTTVVGLLALALLSFKMGPELGFILAKGVFISMLCVFIVLPFLILQFDDKLERCRKKSLHFSMGFFASLSYKVRYFMPAIFIVMFVGFYILQGNTAITFTEGSRDPLSGVFPKDNTVILLYNSKDEEQTGNIISAFENDNHIKSIVGYENTLGEGRTASDMADALAEMDEEIDIDEDMLRMLYYLYYDGKMPTVSAGDFMAFVKDEVMTNKLFSDYLGGDTKEYTDYIDKFGDKKRLTGEMTIGEMADFFGIDKEDLKSLYLYYYTENGGAKTGTMSVSAFTNYVVNDVAEDEAYSSMFDASTLAQMQTLQTYTDKAKMEQPRSYWDTAEVLGMDEESAKMLYVTYFAKDDAYVPSAIQFSDFVDFMKNDVAKNPMFSSYLDADALAQMTMLGTYTDADALREPLSYTDMAAKLGMDEDAAKMIYVYYMMQNSDSAPADMTLRDFISFMKNEVAVNPAFSSCIEADALNQIDRLAGLTDKTTLEAPLPLSTLAKLLGIDANAVNMIYLYYQADKTTAAVETMKAPLSLGSLADALGIKQETAEMLYIRHQMANPDYRPGAMSLTEFLAFVQNNILGNSRRSAYVTPEALATITGLSAFADPQYAAAQRSPSELAAMLGLDEAIVSADLALSAPPVGTMSLLEILPVLLTDATLAPEYPRLQTMQTIAQASADQNGQNKFSFEAIAELIKIPQVDAKNIFIISGSTSGTLSMMDACALILRDAEIQKQLDESEYMQLIMRLSSAFSVSSGAGEPTMYLEDLISFILSNGKITAMLDESTRGQLEMLKEIIHLAKSNEKLSYQRIAAVLGMEENSIRSIFILHDGGNIKLSMQQTVSFVLSSADIRNTLSSDALAQLETLDKIIHYVLEGTALTATDIADFAGVGTDDAKLLLTYKDAQDGKFETDHYLSVQQVVNYLIENKREFSAAMGDSMKELETAQKLINAAVAGTRYTPSELARLLGMSKAQIEDLYLLYQSKYGDTSSWKLSPQKFVTFTVNRVLPDAAYADYFDEETAAQLKNGKKLIDAVVSDEAYSAEKMGEILAGFSEELSAERIELLYLYYAGLHKADDDWVMTIPQMFNYLCDEVISDAGFADIFDRQTKADLLASKADLNEGIAQMKGENYSRLIFTTTYPEEAEITTAFLSHLDTLRHTELNNDSYIIGTSGMVYEMENSFPQEFALISIVTAVAIYIVVFFAFKNLVVPLVLTLLVQCGVYITVASIGWQGLSVYYLSLLNVQSILMGATIDYAIVFSEYYCKNRERMGKKNALKLAYEGAIHTIMTSGTILILVTAILGVFSPEGIIAQVCTTLSIGSLVAVLLILLVLPGMLAALDRFIVKKEAKPTQGIRL